MVGWLHCFEACTRAEMSWRKGMVEENCSPNDFQEEERRQRGYQDRIYPPKGMPLVTYFL
jgi:hypothetical protein